MKNSSLSRFSRTINFYHTYRPGYPVAILDLMREEMHFTSDSMVADLGSGTGKLSSLFLENGNKVFAIEPNDDMRNFAIAVLSKYSRFESYNGTAEQTGLPDQCADFITAAQAFHWFEPERARRECKRILRSEGWMLLLWNKRVDESSEFMTLYNKFLEQHSTDYKRINLRKIDRAAIENFYQHSHVKQVNFEHQQYFDLAGLIGRYRSCSYAFEPDHPKYTAAINQLTRLFDNYNSEGQISMHYRTEVYYGQLD